MPSPARTSSASGAMPSPHTLSRGKAARSSTSTRAEGSACRAAAAHAAPAGPPPTTTTSQCSTDQTVGSRRRRRRAELPAWRGPLARRVLVPVDEREQFGGVGHHAERVEPPPVEVSVVHHAPELDQ